MSQSRRDANQVLKGAWREDGQALAITGAGTSGSPIPVEQVNTLITEPYDNIALTYIASGDGAGQIQTATYSFQGDTVGVLTLTYNSDNNLINVAKT